MYDGDAVIVTLVFWDDKERVCFAIFDWIVPLFDPCLRTWGLWIGVVCHWNLENLTPNPRDRLLRNKHHTTLITFSIIVHIHPLFSADYKEQALGIKLDLRIWRSLLLEFGESDPHQRIGCLCVTISITQQPSHVWFDHISHSYPVPPSITKTEHSHVRFALANVILK